MSEPYATTPPETERMPPGIPYIVGNEAAERFSFYGMKAILTIFMTEYLIDASGARATMSDENAKFWVHTFVVAGYAFPLLGALVSDWLFGKYKVILWLSIVYCLGHLALAVDETRLGLAVGLSLIAIGMGAIKPCVSAHVGDQFGSHNKHRLSRVFGWFYLSINLGAFISTLLTPILLDAQSFDETFGSLAVSLREWGVKPGPSLAFGVPGVLMAIATFVFWLGRYKFVHIPPRGPQFLKETFSAEGRSVMKRLAPIFLCVAAFWCLFDQTASAWVLQAKDLDRRWLGHEWLPSQLQAVNPLFILILIPLFSYVIYPALNKTVRLTPLRKVGIGMFLTVPAFLVSGYAESRIDGGRVVDFKNSPADSKLMSASSDKSSVADALIDGTPQAWVSATFPDDRERPETVAFRLREYRRWTIRSIRVTPATDLAAYFENRRQNEPNFTPQPEQAYQARRVELLASGDSPAGPWQSLGTLDLGDSDEPATLAVEPTAAKYVMLRVLDNGGADAVALGEVEVLASDSPTGRLVNVSATGERPTIGWQILAYALLTAAEVMVSITCLEFSYTQAPNSMKSVIMSLYLLSVAIGNEFTAVVNWVIQKDDGTTTLPGATYYWFFSAVMLVAACVYVVVASRYHERTYIQGSDLPEAEVDAEATSTGV